MKAGGAGGVWEDTIVAISTGFVKAGIGIVRMSGHSARAIAERMVGEIPRPRYAYVRALRGAEGHVLDEGIVLRFQAPASFTGEDLVEFQVHGGIGVLRGVVGRCLELGARPAEPGEFSRRAFLAGKLDITGLEGVIELIDSESAAEAKAARRFISGEVSARLNKARDLLFEARVQFEALIDFDEEGMAPHQEAELLALLQGAWRELKGVESAMAKGALLKRGIRVVLVGVPNAGKSTLLNALAGEDLAIVTEYPGTTRDIVVGDFQYQDMFFRVSDTAGVREANDPVEVIGVERALREVSDADIVIEVVDAVVGSRACFKPPAGVPIVGVVTKFDLVAQVPVGCEGWLVINGVEGQGVAALKEKLADIAKGFVGEEVAVLGSARQRQGVSQALAVLSEALPGGVSADVRAEVAREVVGFLDRISGAEANQDVLGEIFSRFCIGK